jgi:hypothetical protein
MTLIIRLGSGEKRNLGLDGTAGVGATSIHEGHESELEYMREECMWINIPDSTMGQ